MTESVYLNYDRVDIVSTVVFSPIRNRYFPLRGYSYIYTNINVCMYVCVCMYVYVCVCLKWSILHLICAAKNFKNRLFIYFFSRLSFTTEEHIDINRASSGQRYSRGFQHAHSIILTFVLLCWIFLRANNMADTGSVIPLHRRLSC